MDPEALRAAFEAIDREDFLPPAERPWARIDQPLPIGHGQTNSQPTTVANMLALLDPRPGDRVLDVGTGSGWTTALLTHLVAPDGRVLGTEIVPALVERGRAALAPYADGRAEIRAAAPGILGLPEEAPFDRILVSAEARQLPGELVDQLADGGILVVPVAGVMHRVRRAADGVRDTEHGRYRFVPLL